MLQQQREDFSAMVTSMMNSFNDRYDKLKDVVTELRVSLEYSQQDIAAMKDSMNLHEKSGQTTSSDVSSVQDRLSKLEISPDYLENQTNRNNVVFDGVPEHRAESWEDSEKKVLEIIENTMDLDNVVVERAHRVGRSKSSQRARPIVVKFLKFKDREAVLRSGKKLQGSSMYVREDLSEKVLAKRKAQLPQLREARQNGKVAYFSYDKLVIKDGDRRPTESADSTPAESQPKRVMTRSKSVQGT